MRPPLMLRRNMPLVVMPLLLLGTSLTAAEPPKGIRAKADSLFTGEQWKGAEREYRKLASHSDGEERSYATYRVGMCLAKQGDYPYALVTWYDVFTYDRESDWSARAMEAAADTYIRQLGDVTKGTWLYDWLAGEDALPGRHSWKGAGDYSPAAHCSCSIHGAAHTQVVLQGPMNRRTTEE